MNHYAEAIVLAQKLTSLLHSIFPDILALTGLAMLGYGLYQFIPWLSFVVVGALLVVGGALLARSNK